MRHILLYEEEFTIWNVKGETEMKSISWGRLSFGRFNSISVNGRGDGLQFFKYSDKDILSDKYCIEKTKKEAGEEAETEEKPWEVVNRV